MFGRSSARKNRLKSVRTTFRSGGQIYLEKWFGKSICSLRISSLSYGGLAADLSLDEGKRNRPVQGTKRILQVS